MRLTLNDGASLLGQRLAFINLSLPSLLDPLLDAIPSEHTVLLLEAAPGEAPDWKALSAKAEALLARGFALGLHLQTPEDTDCPLLALASYVQVDVLRFDGLALRELVAHLRKKRGPLGEQLQLIAHNLQSHDEFLFSHKSGFHLFHGPFVAGQRNAAPTRSSVNRMVVLPLLNMVQADASFAAIADKLRGEPTLTYKLLRYLNSPAMGLRMQVKDLSDALSLVGRARFYRWMSLLLFDFSNPSYQDRIVAERALTRGRTLELLAGIGNLPQEPDALFLTGLFSLLDEVLGLPLDELLERAAIPQTVRQALTQNQGPLADALRLVVLGEADSCFEPVLVNKAQRDCGIDDRTFSIATQQALSWAGIALGEVE
jgi:EAL and modified HD-GYP domain-containing signal transduction protein